MGQRSVGTRGVTTALSMTSIVVLTFIPAQLQMVDVHSALQATIHKRQVGGKRVSMCEMCTNNKHDQIFFSVSACIFDKFGQNIMINPLRSLSTLQTDCKETIKKLNTH
jgi:hypothetical protein